MSTQPLVPPSSQYPRPALRARLGLPLLLLAAGCRGGPATILTELDRARHLVGSVRLQLNQANDASNRAVMADTDEASIAFASEAREATEHVVRDTATLRSLLEHLSLSDELRSLGDFQRSWARYASLEQAILALAVENTNLKAQRLAFGPAQQAADAFRDAVVEVGATVDGKRRCQADALAAKATLCVRETQVLLAPHIAEVTDARMTKLEQDMTALEARAGEMLGRLTALATGEPPPLALATSALTRFEELRAQIVSLSRKNTNVRSLQLALEEKPPLVSACDAALQRLERALAGEGSKATR